MPSFFVPDASDPVFIHSGLRTAKTWLWSKFRRLPGTVCFYEPLGERCARLTPNEIATFRSSNWPSHHPAEVGPYYTEYLPLIGSQGVHGYREDFAFHPYLRDSNPADQGSEAEGEEYAYLSRLIESAAMRGGRAVLGCARTVGRIGSLKRQFGGSHLLVTRDLYKQWQSISSQWTRHRNSYFAASYVMIAGCGRHHPLLAAIAARYGIPEIRALGFEQTLVCYRILCEAMPLSQQYEIFLRVQAAAYLTGLAAADLVLDVDALADDARRQEIAAGEIAALTGLSPSLADCRPTYSVLGPDEEANLAITETVLREVASGSFAAAEPLAPPGEGSGVPRSRAMTVALLEQAIETIRAAPLSPLLFKRLDEEQLAELKRARTEALRLSAELQEAQTNFLRLRSDWLRQTRLRTPPVVVTTQPSSSFRP